MASCSKSRIPFQHIGRRRREPPISSPPELRRLAVAIMLGAFMVALDMTMVNVAPAHHWAAISTTSVTTIQWVSTGYLLAMAIVIPITGWAVERFRRAPTAGVTSLDAVHRRVGVVRARVVGRQA